MAYMLLIVITIGMAIRFFVKSKRYKKTAYYQITKNPYSLVKRDKGKYGEYLVYNNLRYFEDKGGKFLFNIYIPKINNHTTEIDMLLIYSKGVFVFESKNFGGWIFGNELHKNWTQALSIGRGKSRKERFYNPIMQNAAHIKHLKRLVGENIPMSSIIVFSDRCILKEITVKSHDVSVVNRSKVLSVVTHICNQTQADLLSPEEINNIYNKLYPYGRVHGESEKTNEPIRTSI